MNIDWHKSSFSASGNCVEVGWTKSTFSSPNGNSVEVSSNENGIAIRESDDPSQVIVTTPEKFAAFLSGVKAGEFDRFAA